MYNSRVSINLFGVFAHVRSHAIPGDGYGAACSLYWNPQPHGVYYQRGVYTARGKITTLPPFAYPGTSDVILSIKRA